MSDTATATTEAPEAEHVDHGAVLADAWVGISNAHTGNEFTPEQVTAVQESFRAVPAGARGKAQASALKAVIQSGNPAALESILEIVTDLPKASTPRRAKQVDPVTDLTIRAAAALVAYADLTSDPEIGQQVAEQATAWYKSATPDEHKDAVLRLAAAGVKAFSKRAGSGSGGPRKSFSESVADLIERGALAPNTVLTCSKEGVKAKVLKTGEIKVGDKTYTNLSAAAKDVAQGKATNGWAFWQFEDKPVGDLRQA